MIDRCRYCDESHDDPRLPCVLRQLEVSEADWRRLYSLTLDYEEDRDVATISKGFA